MKPRSLLFTELYEKLRTLARTRMAHEQAASDATSLVHEVYLKLRTWAESFQNEQHFLATAARAMRQVLVDQARARNAIKRRAQIEPISVSLEPVQREPSAIEVLLLDELVKRLEEFDPRAAQVTEMRVFLGLTTEEIAAELGVSTRAVKRDWQTARTWLLAELDAHKSRSAR